MFLRHQTVTHADHHIMGYLADSRLFGTLTIYPAVRDEVTSFKGDGVAVSLAKDDIKNYDLISQMLSVQCHRSLVRLIDK